MAMFSAMFCFQYLRCYSFLGRNKALLTSCLGPSPLHAWAPPHSMPGAIPTPCLRLSPLHAWGSPHSMPGALSSPGPGPCPLQAWVSLHSRPGDISTPGPGPCPLQAWVPLHYEPGSLQIGVLSFYFLKSFKYFVNISLSCGTPILTMKNNNIP